MSTQSNAISESAVASHGATCNEISAARRFYWLIKRELWESRSLYLAPLAVAGIFLLGFLARANRLLAEARGAATIEAQGAMFVQTYDFGALALMAAALLVAVFYCLDALYGERRDRSILFWKSLPVSDVTTVLSKASIPLLILPLITFLITVALHCFMLLVSGTILLARGQSLGMLGHLSLGLTWTGLLYHLVVGHGLYYAPFYGWFLLVSAWARRGAFLWAVLPPLAIGVLEKILFNSSHFGSLVESRFGIGSQMNSHQAVGVSGMIFDVPGLSNPGLWIGLLLTALFLLGAVQLRRRKGPV